MWQRQHLTSVAQRAGDPLYNNTEYLSSVFSHSRHNQAWEVQWGTKPNKSTSFEELLVWGHPKKTRPGRHAISPWVCFSLASLSHDPHSSKNILPETWIRWNHFSDYATKTYENKQTKKSQQPLMSLPRPGWLSHDKNPTFHQAVLRSVASSPSIHDSAHAVVFGHNVFPSLSSNNPFFLIFSDSFSIPCFSKKPHLAALLNVVSSKCGYGSWQVLGCFSQPLHMPIFYFTLFFTLCFYLLCLPTGM